MHLRRDLSRHPRRQLSRHINRHPRRYLSRHLNRHPSRHLNRHFKLRALRAITSIKSFGASRTFRAGHKGKVGKKYKSVPFLMRQPGSGVPTANIIIIKGILPSSLSQL